MKKIFFIVIMFMLAGFYYWGTGINKIEVIRVGSECDYAPNNWEEHRITNSNIPIENKDGFYAEGYDIQIAKLVAEHIGARLEVKKIEWQDLIPALQRREIDAIFSGMLDTDERKKLIAFSDTYDFQETEYAIIVNKGSKFSNAKKLNDFYGAVLSGQRGTLHDDAIEQIPGAIHTAPVDTFSEMVEKIVKHEIDGAVIDLDSGRIQEKAHSQLIVIRFPEGEGFKFNYTGTCAGVRKSDTRLLRAINDALGGLSKRDRQRIMDRTIAREWENSLYD